MSVAIQDAPLDSQRLKRHIALFCDRVLKGGRLTRSGGNQPKADEQRETGAAQISNQGERNRQARPEVYIIHTCVGPFHRSPTLDAAKEQYCHFPGHVRDTVGPIYSTTVTFNTTTECVYMWALIVILKVVTQQQQTKLSRKLKRPALPALAEETSERHTEM